MYTERELIKFSLLVERAHRLAFDMALCAAELGEQGRGMAIVADESRNFATKVQSFLDSCDINKETISDATLEMRYLAVNGCLEMLRLHENKLHTKKKLAVIFDEVRNIADDVAQAFDISSELPLILPRVLQKSTIVPDNIVMSSDLRFVVFEIGGKQFCESTTNVREIFLYPVDKIADTSVKIRGEDIPLLHCHSELNLQLPQKKFLPLVIISANYQTIPTQYAFAIDGVPDIFFASIGRNVNPKNIPSEFIRECWNCEEERQMMFLNYAAIPKR